VVVRSGDLHSRMYSKKSIINMYAISFVFLTHRLFSTKVSSKCKGYKLFVAVNCPCGVWQRAKRKIAPRRIKAFTKEVSNIGITRRAFWKRAPVEFERCKSQFKRLLYNYLKQWILWNELISQTPITNFPVWTPAQSAQHLVYPAFLQGTFCPFDTPKLANC